MPIPLYYLGRNVSTGQYSLVADISRLPLAELRELELEMKELRALLPLLERGQLATAGHAVALSQWHQVGG